MEDRKLNKVLNYLRMAIIFEDSHSTTFMTNLEKMIELVLNAKNPQPMLVSEILTDLSTIYNLNFTEIEVTQAIESKWGLDRIVCCNYSVKKVDDKKYILTQKAIDDIESKTNQISVLEICQAFLCENPDIKINPEDMEKLVNRYFYRCFNSNAITIMQLLKQEYTDGVLLSDNDMDLQFSDAEKLILNSFIYWENNEKDKFVYKMVSCCFDYCTMTAKKDEAIYETVFQNKFFVLDTNIIFRAMGINQDNRKTVINAFINKCKEVGITLVVTNETRAEIQNTINYNIDRIRDLTSGSAPVKPKFLREFGNAQYNEDFYQFYCNWCHEPNHKIGDIEGFRKDLLKIADKVCMKFKNETYSTFRILNKSTFDSYTSDLQKYKNVRRGYVIREETVQTDVDNFMYVVDQNQNMGDQDFFALNYFLISADHSFCNWAKNIRKGAIPVVVLPSVWYSIILHYGGRAANNDDYAAFTRFLNFSLAINESEQNEKKTILLQKVSRLNEPVDVKEEILIDVGKKLSSDYDVDDDKIDTLIAESNKTVTAKRVSDALEQKNKEYSENVQNARIDERNKIFDELAKARAKTKQKLYIIICVFLFVLPIFGYIFCIYQTCNSQPPDYVNQILAKIGYTCFAMISCSILGIIESIISKVFYENVFCKCNIKQIEKREKEKLERQC